MQGAREKLEKVARERGAGAGGRGAPGAPLWTVARGAGEARGEEGPSPAHPGVTWR